MYFFEKAGILCSCLVVSFSFKRRIHTHANIKNMCVCVCVCVLKYMNIIISYLIIIKVHTHTHACKRTLILTQGHEHTHIRTCICLYDRLYFPWALFILMVPYFLGFFADKEILPLEDIVRLNFTQQRTLTPNQSRHIWNHFRKIS